MDEKAPPERRQGGGSSSLFICAVTALIICLLIVVTFLVVKLRRAHKKWKLGKCQQWQVLNYYRLCLHHSSLKNLMTNLPVCFHKEKEESDQSVESGKSKSSGEERKPKVSLGKLPNLIAQRKFRLFPCPILCFISIIL